MAERKENGGAENALKVLIKEEIKARASVEVAKKVGQMFMRANEKWWKDELNSKREEK